MEKAIPSPCIQWNVYDSENVFINERKSEQAHIPQAPTLLEKAAHNECQCHTSFGHLKTYPNSFSVI